MPHGLLARLVLFLLPLVGGLIWFEYGLWRSGENWPVSKLVDQAIRSGDSLVGRRYFSQDFQAIKYESILRRSPRILVIGSSRVMQIRSDLFVPLQDQMYNAGGMIQSVSDWEWYVQEVVQGRLPSSPYVLLGVDPWWFKDRYHVHQDRLSASRPRCPDSSTQWGDHLIVLRNVLSGRIPVSNWMSQPLAGSATPYFSRAGYGRAALALDCGFRRDGSYQYEPSIVEAYIKQPRYLDRENPPVIERIRDGRKQFARPVDWSEDALVRFVNALIDLQKSGVSVAVILPPFADESAEAIELEASLSSWWKAYKTELPSSVRAAQAPCFDAGRPMDYGLTDGAFYDGFHPGEVMMARVMHAIYPLLEEDHGWPSIDRERLRVLAFEPRVCPLVLKLPRRLEPKITNSASDPRS